MLFHSITCLCSIRRNHEKVELIFFFRKMVFVDVEDDTEIKKETDQKESMADEEIGADIKKETDQVRLIDYIQIIKDHFFF